MIRAICILVALAACHATPAKPPSASRPPPAPPIAAIAIPDVPVTPDGAQLVTRRGHGGTIARVVATPDGEHLATIADDRIARVFLTERFREIAEFDVPGEEPVDIALASDASRVAIATFRHVVVFDVASRKELARIDTPSSCMAFEPTGDLLVWHGGLARWHAGAALAQLSASGACFAMGWVKPGMLAVFDGDTVGLGDPATAWTPTAGPAVTGDVSIGPGLLAWTNKSDVVIWHPGDPAPTVVTHRKLPLVAIVDHGAAVAIVALDGASEKITLATGVHEPLEDFASLADAGRHGIVRADEAMLCGRAGCAPFSNGPVRALAATPDDGLLVGYEDSRPLAWSLHAPVTVRPAVKDAAPQAPDPKLLPARRESKIGAWFARNGMPDRFVHDARPVMVANRGDALVAIGVDAEVRLVKDGAIVAHLASPTGVEPVAAIGFRPGTHELVAGFADGTVRIWNTDAPATAPRELAIGSAVSAIAFGPPNDLAVASDDGRVRIFAGSATTPRRTLELHATTALAIAMLPRDRIATGHLDGGVRIANVATGVVLGELRTLDDSEWIAIGPDGRFESSLAGDGEPFYGVRDGAIVPFAEFAAHRRRRAVVDRMVGLPEVAAETGPRLVPQVWTRHEIQQLAFTPDGHELVARMAEGSFAFDVATGLLRGRLANRGERSAIGGHSHYAGGHRLERRDLHTGELVATDRRWLDVIGALPDGGLVARDTEHLFRFSEQPLVEVARAAETYEIKNVGSASAIDPTGRFVATLADSTVRLHATSDLHLIASVRCSPDPALEVAVDSTGTWIACSTVRGSIVVTRVDGSARFVVKPAAFKWGRITYELAFHPTKPLLAVAHLDGASVFDLAAGGRELVLAVDPTRFDSAAWSPDGALLALGELGGKIQLVDPATGGLLRTIESHTGKIDDIARGRSGELLFGEGRELRAWDLATGRERSLADGWAHYKFATIPAGTTRIVSEIPHGSIWSSTLPPHGLAIIDDRERLVRIPLDDADDVALSPDGSVAYALAQNTYANVRTITAWDARDGKQRWTAGYTGDPRRLRVTRGGVVLVVTDDTIGDVDKWHAHVDAYAADGRIAGRIERPGMLFTDAIGVPNGRVLIATNLDLAVWEPATNAYRTLGIPTDRLDDSPDGTHVLTVHDHALSVLDATTLARTVAIAIPDVKIDRAIFVTATSIAALLADGTVRFWNVRDGVASPAGRLVAASRRGSVYVSPTGYYLAEGEGASTVGIVDHDVVSGFERFDATLDRPDLALRELGAASPATLALYAAAVTKRGVRSATGTPPAIEVASALPVHTNLAAISIGIRADGKGSPIAKLDIRVNGIPVFGRAGIDTRAQGSAHVELARDVPLEVGPNRIEIEAVTIAGAASSTTAIVTRDGTRAAGTTYIVAIGVSHYAQSAHDLKFAAKDADDIVTAFAKVLPKGAVKPIVLRDAGVTRAAILALKQTLAATTIDDTVIVFASGHGVLDDDDRYVFGTHDLDFEHPGKTGVSYAELEDLVDGIPARRRLVLLDTCNAGELDTEELAYIDQAERAGTKGVRRASKAAPSTTKPKVDPRARAIAARSLFTTLERGVGATVITASAGAEYSWEPTSGGSNGVFTHALIEGLANGGADLDRDGAVHVTELINYLTPTVSAQTRGFQVPMARSLNRDLDFDLTPERPHNAFLTFDKCIGQGPMELAGRTMQFKPGATVDYSCGAMTARTEAAAKPAATLFAELQATLTKTAAPDVTIVWTDVARLSTATTKVKRMVSRFAGYPADVHASYVAIDSVSKRIAVCQVLDMLPPALARCEAAIVKLVGAQPPSEI